MNGLHEILKQVRARTLDPDKAFISLQTNRISPEQVISLVSQIVQEASLTIQTGPDPGLRLVAQVVYRLLESYNVAEPLSALCDAIGLLSFLEGDYQLSVSWLEKAVHWARQTQTPVFLSVTLGDLGNAYRNVGRLLDAEKVYQEAIEFAEQEQENTLLLNHANNLAIVYQDLGEVNAQLSLLRRALQLAQAMKNNEQIAAIQNNLGGLYREQGDPEGAIRFFEESLEVTRAIGHIRLQTSVLSNLGQAYAELGDIKNAIDYFHKAVSLSKRTKDYSVETRSLIGLAVLYIKEKNFENAERHLSWAVQITEKESLPLTRMDALNAMADLRIETGENPAAAIDLLQAAAQIGGNLRSYFQDPHEGPLIRQKMRNTYDRLIDLLADQERVEEAFLSSEKARTAVFLSALLPDSGGEHSKYATQMIDSHHLTVEAVRQQLHLIGEKSVLVAYYVSSRRIHVFVMRADDDLLTCASSTVIHSDLEEIRAKFQREVAEYQTLGDIGESWLELGKWALEPVAGRIRSGDLLFIIPHDLLHNLPLHALRIGGERLIERVPVAYVPAASTLFTLIDDQVGIPKSALVVGVSFTEEAKAVADLLKAAHSMIGDSLDKEELLKVLAEVELAHLSTPGYFDQQRPEKSGLLLAESPELDAYLQRWMRPGFALSDMEKYLLQAAEVTTANRLLRAKDLEDMRLKARLVVLSACESGLAEVGPGEESVGLVQALLRAGVPSIVAALWLVEPKTTQNLMLSFYRRLTHLGLQHKPQALQHAMLEISRHKPHPYYWAPFAMVGGAALGAAAIYKE